MRTVARAGAAHASATAAKAIAARFKTTCPDAESAIWYAGYQAGYEARQAELEAWRDYGEQLLADLNRDGRTVA